MVLELVLELLEPGSTHKQGSWQSHGAAYFSLSWFLMYMASLASSRLVKESLEECRFSRDMAVVTGRATHLRPPEEEPVLPSARLETVVEMVREG